MIVHFKDYTCRLVKHIYAGTGRIALELVDDEGPVARATVNMPEVKLAPDEILIKDYSENEGMLDALVNAGVVTDTGRREACGYVSVAVGKLTPEFFQHHGELQ